MSGKIEYDTNFIDYQTKLRNLKTNCIELTERIYIDKPLKRQKDVPIENQHALASTFNNKNDNMLNRNTTLIMGANGGDE